MPCDDRRDDRLYVRARWHPPSGGRQCIAHHDFRITVMIQAGHVAQLVVDHGDEVHALWRTSASNSASLSWPIHPICPTRKRRETTVIKPLGRKAYGSIAHLPNSRLGPGDHKCHAGQAHICTLKARDRHDRIIVTEKLDGSNTAVANVNGSIVALSRAGHLATTSPYEQHHLFAHWVRERYALFQEMLADGEALHGEWLALAHGTIYRLQHDPFVAFDLTRQAKRQRWDEIVERCRRFGVVTPRVLHDGGPITVDAVRPLLATSGHGVAPGETVEGAVWRVERRGQFDFLAKWVRPDKVDGKYLESVSGQPAIWQWRPER